MADWSSKESYLCLDNPFCWSTASKDVNLPQDMTYPFSAHDDEEDNMVSRVFYDNVHDEVILIRGVTPKEFFLSHTKTKSWVRFPLVFPEGLNILNAGISKDFAFISIRTSDKDVRIHDTNTGLMLESKSCRGTSASMLALQWIDESVPALSMNAVNADPLSHTKHTHFPNSLGIHSGNENYLNNSDLVISETPDLPDSHPPSCNLVENPYECSDYMPQTYTMNPVSSGLSQFVIFITSVGIELHQMIQNRLHRVKTVAINIMDYWTLPSHNIILIVTSEYVFHTFYINTVSSTLTRTCKFELEYSLEPVTTTVSSPANPRHPNYSLVTHLQTLKPAVQCDMSSPVSLTHGLPTPDGCIGLSADLSLGGLVAGGGNITLTSQSAAIIAGTVSPASSPEANDQMNHDYRLSVANIDGKVYCLLVDETAARLFLLCLVNGSMMQTHVYDLYMKGRCSVHVVDNVIIVYNLVYNRVFFYDVFSVRDEVALLPCALSISYPAKLQLHHALIDQYRTTVTNLPHEELDAAETSLKMHTWLFMGNKVINTNSNASTGVVYTLNINHYNLLLLWYNQQYTRLFEFLQNRSHPVAKRALLLLIRACISNTSVVEEVAYSVYDSEYAFRGNILPKLPLINSQNGDQVNNENVLLMMKYLRKCLESLYPHIDLPCFHPFTSSNNPLAMLSRVFSSNCKYSLDPVVKVIRHISLKHSVEVKNTLLSHCFGETIKSLAEANKPHQLAKQQQQQQQQTPQQLFTSPLVPSPVELAEATSPSHSTADPPPQPPRPLLRSKSPHTSPQIPSSLSTDTDNDRVPVHKQLHPLDSASLVQQLPSARIDSDPSHSTDSEPVAPVTSVKDRLHDMTLSPTHSVPSPSIPMSPSQSVPRPAVKPALPLPPTPLRRSHSSSSSSSSSTRSTTSTALSNAPMADSSDSDLFSPNPLPPASLKSTQSVQSASTFNPIVSPLLAVSESISPRLRPAPTDSDGIPSLIPSQSLHSSTSTFSYDYVENDQSDLISSFSLQNESTDLCYPYPTSFCYLQTQLARPYSSRLYSIITSTNRNVLSQQDISHYIFLPILTRYHSCVCRGSRFLDYFTEVLCNNNTTSRTIQACEHLITPLPHNIVTCLLEYSRSLYRHRIKIEPALSSILTFLILNNKQYNLLSCAVSTQSLISNEYLTDSMFSLSLEPGCPSVVPQLALDVAYRKLNDVEATKILYLYLNKGYILPALKLVSHRSNLFKNRGLTPKDFLSAALKTNNQVVFFTTYRFFEQRNLILRGNSNFIAEDDCDEFVTVMSRLFNTLSQH